MVHTQTSKFSDVTLAKLSELEPELVASAQRLLSACKSPSNQHEREKLLGEFGVHFAPFANISGRASGNSSFFSAVENDFRALKAAALEILPLVTGENAGSIIDRLSTPLQRKLIESLSDNSIGNVILDTFLQPFFSLGNAPSTEKIKLLFQAAKVVAVAPVSATELDTCL